MKNITFIRAGAGSGKTCHVTQRVEEAIRTGRCRVEGLLATTFTKKAAKELRERLRTRLYAAGLALEAGQLSHAPIGTVHSVAEQLLHRFAFEAGISPQLQILDEPAAQALSAQAMDLVSTPEEIGELQAVAFRLGQRDAQTKDYLWRNQVRRIQEQARNNALSPDVLPSHAEASCSEFLGIFGQPLESFDEPGLRQVLDRTQEAISNWGDSTGTTAKYLDQLMSFKDRLGSPDQSWGEWLDLLKSEPAKRKIPDAVKALLEQVRAEVARFRVHPALHADIRHYTNMLFELASRSLVTFQQLKEERGLLDFTDLEYRAWQLVRTHAEVRSQLRQSLDLLVVDEFQDTSPLQLALFLELAGCAKEVVWVGDVKQAIYGFRNSDPELIDAVVADLGKHGNLGQPLSRSYRSVPDLVNLVNGLFTAPFAKSLQLKPEEVQLEAHRQPMAHSQPAIEVWDLAKGQVGGRFTLQQMDSCLALGIEKLLKRQPSLMVLPKGENRERPLRAADVAILCRKNKRAAAIAEALGQRGIPTNLGGPGLLSTPEACLALACLRRMADPSDLLATAEIIALTGNRVPEDWLTDRLHYLKQKTRGTPDRWGVEGDWVEPRLIALDAASTALTSASVSEALDLALTQADVFAVATAWGPNQARACQRRANLEALRTLAARYEESMVTTHAPSTLGGFLVWCDQLAETEKDDQAGAVDTDAVSVLTYHSAKGLEWPVVVCMELDAESNPRLFDVQVITEAGATISLNDPLAGRRIRFWASPFGRKTTGIDLLDELHNSPGGQAMARQLSAEELRLLYVAMTRARDHLVLPLPAAKSSPWLEQVAPSGLLWEGDKIKLPGSEVPALPALRQSLEPPAESTQPAPVEPERFWFPSPCPTTPKLPARWTPSEQSELENWEIRQIVDLGDRLPLQGRPDDALLGDALHAILAASCRNPGTTSSKTSFEKILKNHGMNTHLDHQQVAMAVERFQDWVTKTWAPKTWRVETPFHFHNEAGQRVTGFIDLLLETDLGWIIIDHKSFPGNRSRWASKALSYSGQMAAYIEGLTRNDMPCAGVWIHFPVGGSMVELGSSKP